MNTKPSPEDIDFAVYELTKAVKDKELLIRIFQHHQYTVDLNMEEINKLKRVISLLKDLE